MDILEITKKELIDFFNVKQTEQICTIDGVANLKATHDFSVDSNLDIMASVLNEKYFNNYIYILWSKFKITLEMYENGCIFVNDHVYTVLNNFIFSYKLTGYEYKRYFFELDNIYKLNIEQMDRISITSLLGGTTQKDLYNISLECKPLGYYKRTS